MKFQLNSTVKLELSKWKKIFIQWSNPHQSFYNTEKLSMRTHRDNRMNRMENNFFFVCFSLISNRLPHRQHRSFFFVFSEQKKNRFTTLNTQTYIVPDWTQCNHIVVLDFICCGEFFFVSSWLIYKNKLPNEHRIRWLNGHSQKKNEANNFHIFFFMHCDKMCKLIYEYKFLFMQSLFDGNAKNSMEI